MLPEYQFAGQDMNLGKGAALRLGVQQAVADYYIYTDVDLPYTAGSMQAILEQITNGKKDIIIGSRNEQYYRNVNRFRAGLSKLLRFFIRKLLRIPFDDTQCGLKAFNNTGKEIFLSTTVNRYLFDMEFVMLASKNKNIRLDAVPVELRQGVTLSKIPFKIFIQEVKNFIYLLLK
jgi:glycosyltransferase involved in cell wall biosynthesis